MLRDDGIYLVRNQRTTDPKLIEPNLEEEEFVDHGRRPKTLVPPPFVPLPSNQNRKYSMFQMKRKSTLRFTFISGKRTVYVGGIPESMVDSDVAEYLESKYGVLKDYIIHKKHLKDGQLNRFGFFEFSHHSSATKSLQDQNFKIETQKSEERKSSYVKYVIKSFCGKLCLEDVQILAQSFREVKIVELGPSRVGYIKCTFGSEPQSDTVRRLNGMWIYGSLEKKRFPIGKKDCFLI